MYRHRHCLLHPGRIRSRRRNRRTHPVGGVIARPLREDVTFRSFPLRLEDVRAAPHGIPDTVARPILPSGANAASRLYPQPPRRDRRPALCPRLRGPSHRPRHM